MQDCNELEDEAPWQFTLRDALFLTLTAACVFASGRGEPLHYAALALVVSCFCSLGWKFARWITYRPGSSVVLVLAGVVLAAAFMATMAVVLEVFDPLDFRTPSLRSRGGGCAVTPTTVAA